jgi:hypothetical protein
VGGRTGPRGAGPGGGVEWEAAPQHLLPLVGPTPASVLLAACSCHCSFPTSHPNYPNPSRPQPPNLLPLPNQSPSIIRRGLRPRHLDALRPAVHQLWPQPREARAEGRRGSRPACAPGRGGSGLGPRASPPGGERVQALPRSNTPASAPSPPRSAWVVAETHRALVAAGRMAAPEAREAEAKLAAVAGRALEGGYDRKHGGVFEAGVPGLPPGEGEGAGGARGAAAGGRRGAGRSPPLACGRALGPRPAPCSQVHARRPFAAASSGHAPRPRTARQARQPTRCGGCKTSRCWRCGRPTGPPGRRRSWTAWSARCRRGGGRGGRVGGVTPGVTLVQAAIVTARSWAATTAWGLTVGGRWGSRAAAGALTDNPPPLASPSTPAALSAAQAERLALAACAPAVCPRPHPRPRRRRVGVAGGQVCRAQRQGAKALPTLLALDNTQWNAVVGPRPAERPPPRRPCPAHPTGPPARPSPCSPPRQTDAAGAVIGPFHYQKGNAWKASYHTGRSLLSLQRWLRESGEM